VRKFRLSVLRAMQRPRSSEADLPIEAAGGRFFRAAPESSSSTLETRGVPDPSVCEAFGFC
jgi:hypothetical protein